jgi:hypothetical protein
MAYPGEPPQLGLAMLLISASAARSDNVFK